MTAVRDPKLAEALIRLGEERATFGWNADASSHDESQCPAIADGTLRAMIFAVATPLSPSGETAGTRLRRHKSDNGAYARDGDMLRSDNAGTDK